MRWFNHVAVAGSVAAVIDPGMVPLAMLGSTAPDWMEWIGSTAGRALTAVAQVLAGADFPITIEGHTDDVGSESYNQDLSERRALAVRDFLVDSGMAPSQVQSAGFGESLPVAPNSSPEGRQRNRRVDLVIPDPPQ